MLSITRRQALRVGGMGLLGLTLPKMLQAEPLDEVVPKAKSVIFLFQWGGPSHVDMFDMKPQAADGIRSPYQVASSSVPGIGVCEHLPKMAKCIDRFTQIRSMTHTMKNHNSAGYYALTGHAPPSDDQRLRDSLDLYPGYSSVVDHLAPSTNGMPLRSPFPMSFVTAREPRSTCQFPGQATRPVVL